MRISRRAVSVAAAVFIGLATLIAAGAASAHPSALGSRADGQVLRLHTTLVSSNTNDAGHGGPGDLVALLDAGAYGFCMSSQYLARPRCAEVLVHEGKAELIRKRETYDDLLQNQLIPGRLL